MRNVLKTQMSLALVLMFGFLPNPSRAATFAELQAQVQALLAQVAVIQTQIQTIHSTPQNNGGTSCPNFTRNISRGSRGSDIAQLQEFLVARKLLPTDSVTGFFGVMTEAAVKQFQCGAMNICSGSPHTNGHGAVGPRTRAVITSTCALSILNTAIGDRTITPGNTAQPPEETATQVLPIPTNTTTITWIDATSTTTAIPYVHPSMSKNIQTTLLENSAPYKALFHTHNQHVAENTNGIFVSYVTAYDDNTLDASWKLVRSVDNGASFSTLYTGTSEQSPPALESDVRGNVYLIYPTQTTDTNPTTATFLKFSAQNGFANPVLTKSLPNASSKFTTLYDQYRDHIYYFTAADSYPGTVEQFRHKNFLVLSPEGDVVRAVSLTQGGDAVPSGVQYPMLANFGYDLFLAWTTDDSEPGSAPHYRTIHIIKTDDAGNTFKKLDGTVLSSAPNTPIIADETGPTDRITRDDEVAPNTWLSGLAATNYKVHAMYNAYSTDLPSRQHYVRLDAQSGTRITDIQPTWCLETRCILNTYIGGGFSIDLRNRWDSSTLYAVSGESGVSKPLVFKSTDDGKTWSLYATSNTSFPPDIYTIGTSRTVASDGSVIGAFVQQNGTMGKIIFFRIPE